MFKHKVIGIIPARFKSSRFPGKVLANILGKSLIQRTFENVASVLPELVVATDDLTVFEHVKGFGGNVVMTSPTCLSGSDRAAEVVKKHYQDATTVMVVQADEPLLDPSIVSTLINDLHDNEKADMVTALEPIVDPEEVFRPGIVKCVFDKNRKALYFSRSPIPFIFKKEEEHPFYRHIGVYCYRKEFLLKFAELPPSRLQKTEDLEQLKILENGYAIYVSVVASSGNIGVDYPEDIKKVELVLCRENTFSSQAVSSLL